MLKSWFLLALALASAIATSMEDGNSTLAPTASFSSPSTDGILATLRHSADDISGSFQTDTGQAATGLGTGQLPERQEGKAVIELSKRQNLT